MPPAAATKLAVPLPPAVPAVLPVPEPPPPPPPPPFAARKPSIAMVGASIRIAALPAAVD